MRVLGMMLVLLVVVISALGIETLVVGVTLGLDADTNTCTGLLRDGTRCGAWTRRRLIHGSRVLERLVGHGSIVRVVTVELLALGVSVVGVWNRVGLLRCTCTSWLGLTASLE